MAEKIEQLISEKALSSFDELNAKLALGITGFEKLIAEGVELNQVLSQSTGGFKKFNEETKLVDANTKAIQAQSKQLEQIQAKLNATFTTTAEDLAKARVASAEVNKQLRDQARDALGLTDAYDKLTREYNAAAKEARNLSVEFGKNSKEAKAASDRALELDKRLKDADASVGRFNKNVGNYSGALKILERGLTDVRAKIDQYGKAGSQNAAVIAQLQKEENLLNQLLNSQVNGFVTATGEIKENTKAIQQLSAAGLESTEVYRDLFKATADLKDETDDLKTAIKNAAPDDLAFNAAADAARGLIGVYGLAKSGAAAFGLENEALEETLVKLQAAETALQSIEAIRAVFKKENAVSQAISIGLQKVEIIQTNLQAAAESKNIIVRYGAIAAQKALNAVMALGAGPILGIIGAISLLVVTLSSFASASDKAKRNFKALNEEFQGFENLLNDRVDLIKNNAAVEEATLQSQFVSEEKIRKARRKALVDESAEVKKFLTDRSAAYKDAFDESVALGQRQDAGQKLSDKEKERLAEALTYVDNYNKTRKHSDDLESQLEVNRLNNLQENTEESIKARQENIDALRKQLETEASLQQSIAGDEYKTYEQRLAALREFGRLQAQLINSEANKQLLTPGQTPSEIRLIEAERSAALLQSRRDLNKQIEELTRTYQQRELQAQKEITQIGLQMISDRNQRISDNEELSVTARMEAYKKYYEAQKALIVGQTDFELQNKTLLESERKAIQEKSNADLLNLQIEFLKRSKDINTSALEQSMQDTIRMNNIRVNNRLASLAQEREAGLISEKEYQDQRAQVEFDGAQNDLKILINQTKAKITIREAEGKKIKDLLDQLAEYEKQLNENSLANTKQTEEKKFQARMEAVQKFGQLATNIFSTVNEINQIQFDQRQKQIEEETIAIEKKYQAEVAAINASALSEEEKATRLQRLSITYEAQKQQQELKTRQMEHDRAKAERAITIQRIIADTAASVVATLGAKPWTPLNIALAATVGALGAAQLARVIATPLPAFAEGTDNAPGGPSWVGDGGRHELVQEPGGKTWITPNVPTIMNIAKGSIVYPDARKILEYQIASSMAVNAAGRLIEKPVNNMAGIEHKLDKLTQVIKNKGELNMNASKQGFSAMWRFGANSIRYVEDKLKW